MNARRTALLAGLAATLALVLAGGSGGASQSAVGFATPIYVDQQLAGGEPEVIADTLHGKLVYTSHEGTTHLYRDGYTMSPWGDFSFVSNYCNQVNVWNSSDGVNWFRARYLGTTCPTSPAENTGFSDPDLTFDAGGRLYNTGIDLVNDALFSSPDGGQTWDRGTADCHDGDRPWLAGARANQVYLATDTLEGSGSGHQVFVSNDGGNSCSSSGVADNGSLPDGGSYSGFGKPYYDKSKDVLVEPAVFNHPDGSFGVGISVSNVLGSTGLTGFTPHEGAKNTSMYAHWPAIAIDKPGTIYVVWDTENRAPNTTGGCGSDLVNSLTTNDSTETALPNKIMLVYTKNLGATWSKPIALAHPTNARVLWPWVAAGDAGRISVVWYQTEARDNVPDLDCQAGHIHVMEDTILNATNGGVGTPVDAAGRYVHFGWVCQGGTTCVVTGQDRRLGDYFTNALDARGCVIIATGDTRLTDPTTGAPYPTARPLFVRQSAGPALYGSRTCG